VLPLPIGFYLPLTELQFRLEELEYSSLLDAAALAPPGSIERSTLVAGFALSHYGATIRLGKPFLPMHGETFDIVLPARGLRVLGEAVHTSFKEQTIRHAWVAQGAGWTLEADDEPVVAFKGTHLDFHLNWRDEITFADGEAFSYRKPTSVLGGLLSSRHKLTHSGAIRVRSTLGPGVDLTFHEPGLLSGRLARGGRAPARHEVRGAFVGADGVSALGGAPALEGAWHLGLDSVAADGTRTNVWTLENPAPSERHDMGAFAARLNGLTPDLLAALPPTDSRRRPDVRALEEGRYEDAYALKAKLENALAAKLGSARGSPPARWFEPRGEGALDRLAGDHLRYRYKGGYWEARASGEWGAAGVDGAIFSAAE
jgi:hypothetical protein